MLSRDPKWFIWRDGLTAERFPDAAAMHALFDDFHQYKLTKFLLPFRAVMWLKHMKAYFGIWCILTFGRFFCTLQILFPILGLPISMIVSSLAEIISFVAVLSIIVLAFTAVLECAPMNLASIQCSTVHNSFTSILRLLFGGLDLETLFEDDIKVLTLVFIFLMLFFILPLCFAIMNKSYTTGVAAFKDVRIYDMVPLTDWFIALKIDQVARIERAIEVGQTTEFHRGYPNYGQAGLEDWLVGIPPQINEILLLVPEDQEEPDQEEGEGEQAWNQGQNKAATSVTSDVHVRGQNHNRALIEISELSQSMAHIKGNTKQLLVRMKNIASNPARSDTIRPTELERNTKSIFNRQQQLNRVLTLHSQEVLACVARLDEFQMTPMKIEPKAKYDDGPASPTRPRGLLVTEEDDSESVTITESELQGDQKKKKKKKKKKKENKVKKGDHDHDEQVTVGKIWNGFSEYNESGGVQQV